MKAREFGNQLLTRLLTHAVDNVPGAIGAGLSIASMEDGGSKESVSPHSVAAVGVAADLDRAQWAGGTGPLWESFRSGNLVVRPEPPEALRPAHLPFHPEQGTPDSGVPDDANDDGLPDHSSEARRLLGLERVAGVPHGMKQQVAGAVFSTGEWGGELPVVLSVYLDRAPDEESLQAVDTFESMLASALAVVEYCAGEELLATQMVEMTQYRRVIEQAKGLVMGALGCDAATAFGTLSRASQHFNVPMRHLSVALVEHVGSAAAEHPEDPDLVVRPSHDDREKASKVWAALTASSFMGSRG